MAVFPAIRPPPPPPPAAGAAAVDALRPSPIGAAAGKALPRAAAQSRRTREVRGSRRECIVNGAALRHRALHTLRIYVRRVGCQWRSRAICSKKSPRPRVHHQMGAEVERDVEFGARSIFVGVL